MNIIERVQAALPKKPGITTREICDKAAVSYEQCRGALNRLSNRRQISKVVRENVAFWYDEPPSKPPQSNPTPSNRINKMAGQYDCPELRATPYRPGAQDAFSVPSRGIG